VAEKKGGTNPYCPPVLAMPFDDAQLIIESDEVLPAGSGKKIGDEIIRTQSWEETVTRAHIKIPFTKCQSFVNATAKDESNGLSTPQSYARMCTHGDPLR
jgi:hypothetical protein